MSATVINLAERRNSVRLEGRVLHWCGRTHYFSRRAARALSLALQEARVDALDLEAAGFRLRSTHRLLELEGHGIGPIVLGLGEEAATLTHGLALISAGKESTL